MDSILGEDPRLGRALNAVEKGHQAQVVLRFLEEYLLGRQRSLDIELFAAEPAKWPEIVRQKIEAHRFVLNLSQLLSSGESAGRILKPLMDR